MSSSENSPRSCNASRRSRMVIRKKLGIRECPLSFDADGDAMHVQLQRQPNKPRRAGSRLRTPGRLARAQTPCRNHRRRRRTACRRHHAWCQARQHLVGVAENPKLRRRSRCCSASRRRAIVARIERRPAPSRRPRRPRRSTAQWRGLVPARHVSKRAVVTRVRANAGPDAVNATPAGNTRRSTWGASRPHAERIGRRNTRRRCRRRCHGRLVTGGGRVVQSETAQGRCYSVQQCRGQRNTNGSARSDAELAPVVKTRARIDFDLEICRQRVASAGRKIV